MSKKSFEELLKAGVHFGHLKSKWNPAMAPYIFMEKHGIHIIDLNKTADCLEEAAKAVKQIAKSGRKVLFVATKKQAKETVSELVKDINMPYITERWSGGMLTNFPTIRKTIKKMDQIDKMFKDGTFDGVSKREKLQISRTRAKMEKQFGSISGMVRMPAALFVVDVMKEKIAVKEANRLGIPVFGIVDTNSDPSNIDFVIPGNDDATNSIDLIIGAIAEAMKEGLTERQTEKEALKEEAAKEEKAEVKEEAPKAPAKAEKKEEAPKVAAKEEKTEVKEEAPKADAGEESEAKKEE